MVPSYLTLRDLERSVKVTRILKPYIIIKKLLLLLLNSNRKLHIGSPMPSSHLTMSNLERSISKVSDFEVIPRKGAE